MHERLNFAGSYLAGPKTEGTHPPVAQFEKCEVWQKPTLASV